jgi:hypothetical protein
MWLFKSNGNGVNQQKAQAVELLFLDATEKTRIGQSSYDPACPMPIPAPGDYATIPELGSPGQVAYVKVERREFVYNQQNGGKSVWWVRLFCREIH